METEKTNLKLKWYLLPVFAGFIAISALSLGIAGGVFSCEDTSFSDTSNTTTIESIGSSTPAIDYSAGLTVRCNVVLDK
jgi:hypothetical protein